MKSSSLSIIYLAGDRFSSLRCLNNQLDIYTLLQLSINNRTLERYAKSIHFARASA